jgi:tetratricopeptide (TPR) repeat protein
LIDDPNNPIVMMLLAQTYFAAGKYPESAGATELAMAMLPENEWGTVVQNYTQLYGNPGDYNSQLLGLEKARTSNPNNAAIRFLLGFHYGYLQYPQQAVRELSQSIVLEPRDAASRKLHDVFAAEIGASPVGRPTQVAKPERTFHQPAVRYSMNLHGATPVAAEMAPAVLENAG